MSMPVRARAEPDGPRIQVLQVRYAKRSLRAADAYHDFVSLGIEDRPLEMDYNFWILRQGRDCMLIDTGYDVDRRDWLGEKSVVPVSTALDALGIIPTDVSKLVLTHFHFDHIGHVALFPNATIYCSRIEYDYWIGKLERDELVGEFTEPVLLEAIRNAHRDGRVCMFDDATTVQPGVTAIVVGGHCPGQLVVTIRSKNGGVILAADAAHYGDQVRHSLPFFAFTDRNDMMAALKLLRQLEIATDWALVPGHDPEVRIRYPTLPGHSEVSVLLDDWQL
jgi:glyoxylase-like metal-dependent hydrolase (beta-lactamase superfamily II)